VAVGGGGDLLGTKKKLDSKKKPKREKKRRAKRCQGKLANLGERNNILVGVVIFYNKNIGGEQKRAHQHNPMRNRRPKYARKKRNTAGGEEKSGRRESSGDETLHVSTIRTHKRNDWMTASSGIMRISSNFHILFKKC
jgi:hypothetical protein